jgi:hypothetical protein
MRIFQLLMIVSEPGTTVIGDTTKRTGYGLLARRECRRRKKPPPTNGEPTISSTSTTGGEQPIVTVLLQMCSLLKNHN